MIKSTIYCCENVFDKVLSKILSKEIFILHMFTNLLIQDFQHLDNL